MVVDPNSGNVTPRELYSHLDAIRSSLGAQIKDVAATIDARLIEIQADIATKQALHQQEHQADRDRRSSLIRWAVTSVMTGAGVVVAIYVAMKGGG